MRKYRPAAVSRKLTTAFRNLPTMIGPAVMAESSGLPKIAPISRRDEVRRRAS